MRKKIKQLGRHISIVMICMLLIPMLTYGENRSPSIIKIGLRSAYSNVASVEIRNTLLEVGYQREDSFKGLATIKSSGGFIIKPTISQYYSDSNTFTTYEEATGALDEYRSMGVDVTIGYIGPKTWKIYSSQDGGRMQPVSHSRLSISIEDTYGETILVCENDESMAAFAGIDSSNSFSLTELSKGKYRGWFEFKRQDNKITAINIVDFEEYLYGVVPAEMPASWNMEALKAQAVVARSMSIFQYNKYIANGYNVCDTTYTQVYKGFSGEHARTNQAVDETRGQLAIYNGKIAETLYHSTSGGYTEDPIYVWGGSYPYLKAVPDTYETEPEMKPWTRTITLSDINLCLEKQNINIGAAKGMRVTSYTPAGRVNELQIIGTSGIHTLTKESIRTFFTYTSQGSLRSRMFSIGDGIISQPTSTLAGGNKVTVEAKGTELATKLIDEIHIIDGSGKLTTVNSSMVVEGKNGTATYGDGKSNKTISSNQEAYGDIIISGQGYGHGVGLSQSGARGMAKAGYTYDQIIEYYYQGVRVER